MRIRLMLAAAILTPALGVATPSFAQGQSEGYKFLSAVRDAKNNDVLEMLGRPGSNIINTRDVTSGEGALHIVIKRSDEVYLRFLLQKGADANLRDGKGNTPLLLAVTLLPWLVARQGSMGATFGWLVINLIGLGLGPTLIGWSRLAMRDRAAMGSPCEPVQMSTVSSSGRSVRSSDDTSMPPGIRR